MTALADALKEKGESVLVFSAFDGLGKLASDDQNLCGYEIHKVADRPNRILSMLVHSKAYLRKLRSRWKTEENPTHAPLLDDQSSDEVRSAMHRWLFNVLQIIDEKKSWSCRAGLELVRMGSKLQPDVIVVSGPPMSSVIAGVLAARRMRVPVVADLRDPIFGEFAQRVSGYGVPVQWGRRAVERCILRHATAVITTSPTLRDRLQQRYPESADRVCCIYNGFDGEPLPARRNTNHRLIIVYAGALYLNRNPFPFLEALEDLLANAEIDSSRIEVVFAGECERFRNIALATWLSGRRVNGIVKILARLNSHELAQLYRSATLLLNFAEGQRMQLPAKTFELLALGREVLMLCEPDSDTANLVRGIGGVECVSSADGVGLREFLRRVYRRHVVEGTLNAPAPDEIAPFSRARQNICFIEAITCARGRITPLSTL